MILQNDLNYQAQIPPEKGDQFSKVPTPQKNHSQWSPSKQNPILLKEPKSKPFIRPKIIKTIKNKNQALTKAKKTQDHHQV